MTWPGGNDRPLWYGLDGNGLDDEAAAHLICDEESTRVAATSLTTRDDERIAVSTIFTVFDCGFGDGPPLLWETMVFGGPHDGRLQRYTSVSDARRGHESVVAEECELLDAIGTPVLDRVDVHAGMPPAPAGNAADEPG